MPCPPAGNPGCLSNVLNSMPERTDQAEFQSAIDLERLLEGLHEPLILLDEDLVVHKVNARFLEAFRLSREKVVGRNFFEIGNQCWKSPQLQRLLSTCVNEKRDCDDYEFQHEFPEIGHRRLRLNFRPLRFTAVEPNLFLLAIDDRTELKPSAEPQDAPKNEDASDDRQLIPHVEFTLTPTGEIATWNPAAEMLLGFSEREALGNDYSLIFSLTDREAEIPQQELEAAKAFPQFESERWYRCKDGAPFQATSTLISLRDTTGALTGFSMQLKIAPDDDRGRKLWHTNEARLLIATEIAEVFTWECDFRSQTIAWSENTAQVLGCSPEELPMYVKDSHFFVAPEDVPRIYDEFEHVVARHQESFTSEFRGIGDPVTAQHFLARVRVEYDTLGQPVKAIGATQDITRHKHIEQKLQTGEEWFRTLADNISQFAWMADADGWVFWYNQRWYEYTGTTREEMQGWGWKKVHHPDHVDRVVTRVQHSWDTGEPWEDTFPLKGKDGNYRWYLSRALPIRDSDGDIIRWFGTNTDVTELRQIQQALKDADRQKDEFLAMLAHEIRNPLAPIRSGIELLALGNGEHQETLKMMQDQVDHLVRLVDDLLDVSRIIQGKIDLRREPVELGQLLDRAVESVRNQFDEQQQEFTLSLPEEEVWLEADPVRLVQVFDNLLNNASKYTDGSGRIALTAHVSGDEVLISVRDSGIGIESDLLRNVFDLFTQSTRALDRAQGGLGIGLTLVRQLVELHGGKISAQSEGEGQGSTFTVKLPVTDAPGAGAIPEELPCTPEKRRILVVDDNRSAAYLIGKLLESMGDYQIESVHDGTNAVERITDTHPDIVLLDIGLPGKDGYKVAQEIRAQPQYDNILLVALTGYGQKEAREKSREVGFDEHLVKPLSLDQLKQLLNHPKLNVSP